MQQGLVGQTVGSRVMLVVPPALGYPAGNEKPKIAKDETLVFVVDLLFAQAGQ
jgi:peptidylprolyl isomerase